VCSDEVALSQKIDCLACAEGTELLGIADRVQRSAVPAAARIIFSPEGELLHYQGGQMTKHAPTELPQILSQHPRATQACVWLIFEPVRCGTVKLACVVPTRGDLTAADDAAFFHAIVVTAHEAGLLVTHYGGDGASPHAQFVKGILAPLSSDEEDALRLALAKGVAIEHLVATHNRPVGVLQQAQMLLEADPDAPVAARLQWRVPYPGVCAAFSRCAVTGELVGNSYEWRHADRLNVRSHTLHWLLW
jgi:hypothetical protein